MQFISQEEGRVRMKNSTALVYDYFIKDHLGNVRMVLTDAKDSAFYPVASLETANLAMEKLYYAGEDSGRVNKSGVSGYPSDTYTNPNDFIQQLSGSGFKIGTSIVLKVMSGDKFNLRVSSWYKKNGTVPATPVSPLTPLINALVSGIGGVTNAAHGATATELQNSGALVPGAVSFYSSHNTADSTTKPKAFVNWILFDEQFKYVAASSGFEQVGADNAFTTHVKNNLDISRNGYLYIYVSNETPNINVYFDNLQVTHIKGAIVEETHYYPFGLTMSGISSQAANSTPNKIKFQEQELASKEFSDGSGLEMYEFKWRMHDPQTGRFWQIDPLAQKYVYNSTYAFSENKVTGHRELEGLEAWSVNPTTVNGNPGLSATVTNANAPFSVTQGGATTGFFPNAQMNQQLGGAMVSQGSLLVPVNANGDYNSYSGEGVQNFTYNTDNLALTPTTTTNVITNGAPVVINGNRNATDPIATTAATTITTGAITSATAPAVNLTYSDQAGLPNTFNVTNNSTGTNVIRNATGNGTVTTTAPGFVSGGTMSVTTSNQQTQRGDGYNFTLTVTPTVSTPTTVPTQAATNDQLRIVQGQSRSLLNNVSLY